MIPGHCRRCFPAGRISNAMESLGHDALHGVLAELIDQAGSLGVFLKFIDGVGEDIDLAGLPQDRPGLGTSLEDQEWV
jgi:hypothetical protein